METIGKLLTKADVAERLCISERTIERLVKKRNFPPPGRWGKSVYWEESAVRVWLDAKLQRQRSWKPKV